MINGIHHIVVFCENTEQSKEWYEKAGFTYKEGYEGMHWFMFGSIELMLHPTEKANPGHTEIYLAVSDIHEAFTQVVNQGLEPTDHQQGGVKISEPVTRPWGSVEFELQDPDGHRFAFAETSK